MRSIFVLAFAYLLLAAPLQAQSKVEPRTVWGNLSGKMIDEKTRNPIADAIVCLKAPDEGFPIHADDRVRKDLNIKVPQGQAFDFRVLTNYPRYYDGKQHKTTGQKLTLIGDAMQDHIFALQILLPTADKKTEAMWTQSFARRTENMPPFRNAFYLAAGEKITLDDLRPVGYTLESQTYRQLKAVVFVFEHPYFAITKKDGTFTIPRVPVGEAVVWAWHEEFGNLLTKSGQTTTLKEGDNTLQAGGKK